MIVIAALSIRIFLLAQYVGTHSPRALSTIPFLFEPGNIAFSLVNGDGFGSPFRVDTGPTAWMTPVWPLILATIFKIFGTYTFNAFLATAGFNISCSTATCIPVHAVAERIAGKGPAAIATWLWALFPTAILLAYESLWDASLSALILTTLLWASISVADSSKSRHWGAYGLLWGFGLMTNAAILSLLPVLFGWAEYRSHKTKQTHPWNWILAAGLAAACCIPWTARNFQTFHTFVPLRSVGGLALWLGNNENGDGLSARQHPISNQRERDRYMELGEIAYMAEKQSQAVQYIAGHPARTFQLSLQRFTAIWTGTSGHLLEDFHRAQSIRFYLVVGTDILAVLGTLLGLFFLARERNPHWIPIAAFPVVFPLVYYLALAPPRYRHPIDPALLILTAASIKATGVSLNRLAHLRRKRPNHGQPSNPS